MRPRPRGFLAVAFFLLVAAAFPETRLLSVEFFPARFTVGTRVELFAKLEAEEGSLEEGSLGPAEAGAGSLGPTIHGRSLKKAGSYYLYTIEFTPWEPGKGVLPPTLVGSETLPAINYETASALEEDGSLPPPRPQEEPGGIRFRVYLAVGASLALLFGAVFAALFLPRMASRYLSRLGVSRARKLFLAVLANLEKGGDSGAEAWKRLCGALRSYLATRLSADSASRSSSLETAGPAIQPLLCLSAREFSALPPDSLPGGVHGEVAAILLRGDMVRWAARPDDGIAEAVSEARIASARLDTALSEKAASSRGKGEAST